MCRNIIYFLSILFFFQACRPDVNEPKDRLVLWYTQPAEEWTDALPVGNGRLGAMVFGGITTERIQLNEESVWSGGPVDRINPEAHEHLGEVRSLLFQGKYAEADKLAQEKIMGPDHIPHSYQTLGDLYLDFELPGEPVSYTRSLDLNSAVAETEFEADGVKYRREVFASQPDEVVVIRISADKEGALNFTARLNRPGEAETISVGENQVLMTGFAEYRGRGTRFAAVAHIISNDGNISSTDSSLIIQDATSADILISGRTDYFGKNEVEMADADIINVVEKEYTALKDDHIREYRKLFDRVEFELNGPDTTYLPTDVRLQQVREGNADQHLTELYFQYGRYLLISSSGFEGLPANLQGIWAESLNPPWNADYHININLQMNYWPALVTNLAETQQPFFEYINSLRERGAETAHKVYGSRGFVAHHTSDAWKFTAPIGQTGWGMWPMGAAWCSDHFWEQYDFTGDTAFLRKWAYPVLRDASLFFVDYLVENPNTGLLVSGPSMSPENKFITPGGESAATCMGPAMDHQIIRELFTNFIKTSEILNLDTALADTLRQKLQKLTPSQIGSDGRILEWSEELPEAEPGHRHISHLYALYPGDGFANPEDTRWTEAARKTIEYRLAHGGGHTGWSRAWIINFFARLKDGEKAYENLQALFAKSTLDNLFDTHPPFQIDGNFGATAAIAEMLLQSHRGVMQILPALPPKWNSGSITGLRARGGFEVDIAWADNQLTYLQVKSLLGNPVNVMYNGKKVLLDSGKDEVFTFNGNLEQQ